MSLSTINILYKIAEERAKSEQGKKELEAEALEDGVEELMTGG